MIFGKKLDLLRINDKTYRATVKKGIILLVFSVICFYSVFYAREKIDRKLSSEELENEHSLEKIVAGVELEFDGIIRYYIRESMRDEVSGMINSDMDYSQFRTFEKVGNALGGVGLGGEYIDSFAIVNYDKGWVFDKKAIYPIEQLVNRDEVDAFYKKGENTLNKYYWVLNEENDQLSELDRDFRYMVETSGLDIIIKLPVNDVNTRGILVVNLEDDAWKKMICNVVDDTSQKLAVMGENGELIYTNDIKFSEHCNLSNNISGNYSYYKLNQGAQYAISTSKSEMLGYRVYVGSDLSGVFGDVIRDVLLIILLAIFAGGILSHLASELLYKPIRKMVRGLSETADDIEGDELTFIEKHVNTLREDKKQIEQLVKENNVSLKELLEIRLVNGKIHSEEEWNDYASKLDLKSYKYFVCVSSIINMGEEDTDYSEVDEVAICMKLVEGVPKNVKEHIWLPLLCDTSAMFCFLGADSEDEIYASIKCFAKAFQEYSMECVGYSLMMGISTVHTLFSHFGLAKYESFRALTMFAPEEDNCKYYLSSNMAPYEDSVFDFNERISDAIRRMDKEQCYKIIDEFDAFLAGRGARTDNSIFVMRMIDSILVVALESRIEFEIVFPNGIENLINEIIVVNEHSRVRRLIKKQLVDPILANRSKLLEADSYATTEQITQLIAEAKGNITLNELAEKMDVHPAFIWKALKMERGKTFSDIQENYKLEEAKRLLLQTNLTVAEIATELNYTNAQNFIRFFSKETGMTPGKFRKLKQL